MTSSDTAVCGAVAAFCVCSLPQGHDAHHHCDCGGEWCYDEDGEFHAITLPGPFAGMEPLEALGAALDLSVGGW